MTLTLPTEVTNERFKQSNEIILLIEFEGLNYHIASRSYDLTVGSGSDGVVSGSTFTSATATFLTWNAKPGDKIFVQGAEHTILTTGSEDVVELATSPGDGSSLSWEYRQVYSDLTSENGVGNLSHSITEKFNRPSSVSSMTIRLLDYRGTLRTDLLTPTPDLTNSTVKVYLKHATSSVAVAGRMQIYSGVISTYKQDKDVLTLTLITTHYKDFPAIPQTLLKDQYTDVAVADDMALPLQYGDFSSGQDWLFEKERTEGNGLAIATYVKTEDGEHIYAVASHLMDNFPSTSTPAAPTVFAHRDGIWVPIHENGTWTWTNGASLAEIRIPTLSSGHGLYPMLEAATVDGTPGTPPDNEANITDGDPATAADFTAGEILDLEDWNAGALVRSAPQSEFLTVHMYVTAITGAGPHVDVAIRKVSDDSLVGSLASATLVAGQWNEIISEEAINLNAEEVYVRLICKTSHTFSASGILMEVYGGTLDVTTENDQFIYVKCRGREFSGTWDGRKTSGAVITHPVDTLESIFRDEFGSSSIDIAGFDAAKTQMTDYAISWSMIRQQEANNFLTDYLNNFNIGVAITQIDTVTAMTPNEDLDFSDGGDPGASNSDIFTDSETVASETFDKHPILLGSFKLSRTDSRGLVSKVLLNYDKVGPEQYLLSATHGSGSLPTEFNNPYISELATATALAQFLYEWRSTQKMIAEFSTFHNAIGIQIGDVINVQHNDLSDGVVYTGDKTTQRWMVNYFNHSLSRGKVDLKAVEVRYALGSSLYTPDASDLLVHFDWKTIGENIGSPDYVGIYPTLPASWEQGTIGNSADSTEWSIGSGYSKSWVTSGAKPGLQLSDDSDSTPMHFRYDNAAQRTLSDQLWPRDKVAIYEFYLFDPTTVVSGNDGMIMCAPWASSTRQFYFFLERQTVSGAIGLHINDGTTTVNLDTRTDGIDYWNTGHFAMVFIPSDGVYIFYNGQQVAYQSHAITSLTGGSSDNRWHLGRRNPGANEVHLNCTHRYTNIYMIDESRLPGNWKQRIIQNNYLFLKGDLGL